MDTLTTHQFIAQEQAMYLQQCKDKLPNDEVIIQLHFAENYSFVVQDAIQGFHWNSSQATIAPHVVYYKDNQEMKHFTYDSLDHSASTEHLFNKQLINHIKQKLPCVKNIKYFSVDKMFY